MATRLAAVKRPNGGDFAADPDDFDGFVAPPGRWQSDDRPLFPAVAAATMNVPTGPAAAAGGPSFYLTQPVAATAEDAERAWRHARRASGTGMGGSLTSPSSSLSPGTSSSDAPLHAPVDLYDALVHSVRETQYTLQPPGVRSSWREKERGRKRANS